MAEERWICEACGNDNKPHRVICNMRKCQAPRPGADPAAVSAAQAGVPYGGAAQQPAAAPAPLPVAPPATAAPAAGAGGGAAPQQGDWHCPQCGNSNRPHRDKCNMRHCQAPRPGTEAYAAPAPAPYVPRAPAPQMLPIAPREYPAPIPPGTPVPGREFSDGSWECPKCKNLNYPGRNTCNMRSCQEPKPGGGPGFGGGGGGGRGGYAPYGAFPPPAPMPMTPYVPPAPARAPAPAPHGEHMGSISYSQAPPEVQAALAAPLPAGLPPTAFLAYIVSHDDLSQEWYCDYCNNRNFPGRSVCNLRKCRKPKRLSQVEVIQIEKEGAESAG